jgi:hypothetical protein
MRSVRGIRGVLAIGAPALLAAMMGAGCRSDQAVGQQPPPARTEPMVTVVDVDRLLPGDQRLPGGTPTVTTAPAQRPIARTSSPVPTDRTPMTRTPVVFPGVETTTTTSTTSTIGALSGS